MKKIFLSLLTAAMLPLMSNAAVGWPANYGGVMLQGFSWDNYVDTQWSNMEKQVDELSSTFDIIWVPQSGNCNTGWNVMGYMPVYWFNHNSSFGTERALRSMISAFKAKGTSIIEDVVINHRSSLGVDGSWVDFPAEVYNGTTYQLLPTDVCADDDGGKTKTWATQHGITLSSNNDTGEGWDGCRDLDHKSTNVRDNVKAYLSFLLNDLGYAGFRYDMVRGYSASYTGEYNAAVNPTFSVGELWDGNVNTLQNWLNATKVNNVIQSACFDFAFRYTVRDAINQNNWTKVGNTSLARNSTYRQFAVTFVENHDMQDRGNVTNYTPDPIKKDTLAANAFLLAMPGTPCVFLTHWKAYKKEIKSMVEARKLAGVTNMSNTAPFRSSTTYYAANTTGSKGKLLAVVGNTSILTNPGTTWVNILSGYHYSYFLSKDIESAWIDVPSGTYETAFPVKLIAVSNSATQLVYTLDGSTPKASSPKVNSGASINITQDCTLTVGLLSGSNVTGIMKHEYKIQPFVPHTATVYLKAPGWKNVYFYSWDKGNVQLLGNWPGTKQTQYKYINGAKFYYHTFDIPTSDYYFNIIFDQGDQSVDPDLKQTVDIGPVNQDVYYEIAELVNGKYTVNDITAQYQGGTETLPGDVNGDGKVNVSDVTTLINMILGMQTMDQGKADVNGDGKVNVSDVTALINIILGIA